jgi:ubiquinone/menaquinone biosynthesis C-methylase UbiE
MDMDALFRIMEMSPGQGPGAETFTRRAYLRLPGIPKEPQILDIGCGSGMQTVARTHRTRSRIIATDIYRPYLLKLQQRAAEKGLRSRISPVLVSMYSLPFRRGSFDLIWSEGAIFVIGFEEGLH